MFSNIFIFLIIALVGYYIVMIILDLYNAKIEEKLKAEETEEMEVDISSEAAGFKPKEITREKPSTADHPSDKSKEEARPDTPVQTTSNIPYEKPDLEKIIAGIGNIPQEVIESYTKDANGTPMAKAPVLTDGIEFDLLITEVDVLAHQGDSDLAHVIHECTFAA